MKILTFLLQNWRIAVLLAGALTAWGTIVHMRGQLNDLREQVTAAETAEGLARSAAAIERGNATRLAEIAAEALAMARADRRAREAAENARDNALKQSGERGAALDDALTTERSDDEDLDYCLSYVLPDGVVRQLPF